MKIAPADEEVGSLPPMSAEGVADEPRRKVTVLGNPESQWKAQYLIFEKLREEGFSQGVEDVKLTVEIMVPSSQVWEFLLFAGTFYNCWFGLTQT